MGQEIKGQGFLLRVVTAQEADIIVRILTSKGEKISGFAKAALKSRKRFGGALEPLTQIDFRGIKKENQDLLYLEETQVRHEFPRLRSDLERLTVAMYLSELTEIGAQEGLENPELYNLIGAAWKALDKGALTSGVSRQFEIKFLSLLGWLPHFDYHSKSPVVGSEETKNIIIKLLRSKIANTEVSEEEAHQVQKITASLLHAHIGSHKLKSTQFLGSLRRFQK